MEDGGIRIEDVAELEHLFDVYSSESLFRLFVERYKDFFLGIQLEVIEEAGLQPVELWREAKAVVKELYSLRAEPRKIEFFYNLRCREYEVLFPAERGQRQEKTKKLRLAVFFVAYTMLAYILTKDAKYEELFRFEKSVEIAAKSPSVDEYTGEPITLRVPCGNLLDYTFALFDPFRVSDLDMVGFSESQLKALPYDYNYIVGTRLVRWNTDDIEDRYKQQYEEVLRFVEKINITEFRGNSFRDDAGEARVRAIWEAILHDDNVLKTVAKKSSQEHYEDYKFSLRWVFEIIGYLRKTKGVYQVEHKTDKDFAKALDSQFVMQADASPAKKIGRALEDASEKNTQIKQVIDGILS